MKKKDEIVSFNEALITFDSGDISLEVLERRLELALAFVKPFICGTFGCATFTSCNQFGCGSFTTG